MRQISRVGVAILIFLTFWIIAAVTEYTVVFVGLFAIWIWLWQSNGRNHLPKMYWQRLREPQIVLFLAILAVTHAVPGAVVLTGFASYFWIFALIASIHIGLEIFLICSRNPKKKMKIQRIASAKPKRKWVPWY